MNAITLLHYKRLLALVAEHEKSFLSIKAKAAEGCSALQYLVDERGDEAAQVAEQKLREIRSEALDALIKEE